MAECGGENTPLEVLKRIGKGAFGAVYLGRVGEREVAVKVLTSDLKDTNDEAAQLAYKLFVREAAVLKTLGAHR